MRNCGNTFSSIKRSDAVFVRRRISLGDQKAVVISVGGDRRTARQLPSDDFGRQSTDTANRVGRGVSVQIYVQKVRACRSALRVGNCCTGSPNARRRALLPAGHTHSSSLFSVGRKYCDGCDGHT